MCANRQTNFSVSRAKSNLLQMLRVLGQGAIRICATPQFRFSEIIAPPRTSKAPLFDTFQVVKQLTDAGLTEEQAVKILDALIQATAESQSQAFSALASKVR